MRIREAIERIKYHFAHHDDGRPTPYLDEAAAMAISALEKQEQKKPKGLSWTHEQRVGNCPCCNKLVGELTDSWVCIKCGQNLEWN